MAALQAGMRALLLAALLVFAPCAAHADVPTVRLSGDEALGLATRWLVEGRAGEAGSLLQQLAAMLPDDPQVVFLQAQAAIALRDYGAASLKLRQLLTRDPALVRVRLDLARTLFLAGDYDAARHHFELALGQDLPETARQNVYRYLRHIQAQAAWLELTVSAGRDSNPGSATSARTVEILGQSFLVHPEAQADPSWGVAVNAHGRTAFGPGQRGYARGLLQLRDYSGRYADYHYAQATVGATAGQGWSVEAGPLAAYYQGKLLYAGGLVEAGHHAPLGARALALQSVSVRHLDYADYQYLDATEGALRMQLRYAASGVSQLALGLSLARSDARENAYSYDAWDVSLGYVRELRRHVNLDLRLGYGEVRYADEWALFGTMRRDRVLRADVSVIARDWALRGFAPLVSAGVVSTKSTIELTEFDRRYLSIGFTRTF
jgi:hypothetical protein